MQHLPFILPVLTLATSLAAQEPYRVADATTQGSFFEVNSLRDHPTDFSLSYAGFATPDGGDSLFELGWFYRVAGDVQNTAFNDDPANVQVLVTPPQYEFGPPEVGLNLGTMDFQWTDVDGRGFDATWSIEVVELGSDRAVATNTMSLTNPTAAPMTIELFCYIDLDVDGGPNDSDERAGYNDRFVVRDANTENFVDVAPTPVPTHYEVDTFAGDLDARIMSGAYDLGDTGLPFAADDWSGAMQWSVTIDPMSTVDVVVRLGRNACPNPGAILASVVHYGVAVPGTLGPPRINAQPPIVGVAFDIVVGNGPTNGQATLMIGDIQQFIPFCGITLLLTPWASLPLQLDLIGTGRLSLLTPCDPNLYGASLFAQAFTIDAGSTAKCFPIAHSDGIQMLMGD